MKVLHVDAGISPNSVSRQISAAAVETIKQNVPISGYVYRDLEANPIAHLDRRGLASLGSDPVLQEFLDADVIVIGAPMYNFGVPSQLKAWFDQILVAGKTFRYTPEGPNGLAGGKAVIIASARGGVYASGTVMEAMDFQERYLSTVLRFIGIENISFIRAEGLAVSPERRDAAIAQAIELASEAIVDLSPDLAA